MSTRAQVRFATREEGVSFSEHPNAIHAQFYAHSDGYPEALGLEIADSLLSNYPLNGWEIESLDAKHGDLEYIYYIWQAPGKETFISIFAVDFAWCDKCDRPLDKADQCIFVGSPRDLIDKYNK